MSPVLAFFVHHLNPWVFRINEKFGVRWYGLAYLAGFVAAGLLLQAYARRGRSLLPADRVSDFMFFIVLGVMIGGRLGYYLLYTPQYLLTDPLSLLRVWDGGMASHGGFIGVALALWIFSRRSRIPLPHLADLIASTTSVGLFFGRIANFINAELVGRVTTVPWAFLFPGEDQPRHPSQLYEAGLEGLVLLALAQWRFWRTDVVKAQPGRLAGEYLLAYAALRALGEVFREPDASLIAGLSRGTFYSIFLVAGGLVFIARSRRNAA